MFYLERVRSAYNEAVRLHPTATSDLKTALKTNERVPIFIDKLAVELQKLANFRDKRGKPPISDKHIKDVVYDMVDVFIKSLEAEAKMKYESDLDKRAREAEASNKREIERASRGEMTGDFADMGLTAVDQRDVM